jgi:nitrate reductase beta subunit
MFLDPFDPAVQAAAREAGIPEAWLEAARESPVYKMAMDWKIAFPLHPEYRTLPMVWYVPPLSPIQAAAQAGDIGHNGVIPDVAALRIPVRYLANLLTAGQEAPIRLALERMLAMRAFMRAKTVDGEHRQDVLDAVGLTTSQVDSMYRYLAIANYEDRFVASRVRDRDLRRDGRAGRMRLQLRQRLRGWDQPGQLVRQPPYDRPTRDTRPCRAQGVGSLSS